ncbi:succinate--CoA ligase subunit alpha [bacterium]|nr:succinate--CoA ligase subunit alpha [candidate division CSSED10-310 bacterium]
MSIFVDAESKVVVQGLTGREGTFQALQMKNYGTDIVAGVTPGKGGTIHEGIPCFNSVEQAVGETGADVSIIFVPRQFCSDAILEAAFSGIRLVVCITEGIPALDMMRVKTLLGELGVRLIGPNCPGIISPGKTKVGIMPGHIHKPGRVGVISRSGTLTYEVVDQLTRLDLGQSTCIGIGGDPIPGTNFIDCLELFEQDADTNAIVLIGEIGGNAEESAAHYIHDHVTKPVTCFIAGQTAPPGRRMGHAGAIISGGTGTAREKIAVMKECGIAVAENPAVIGTTLASLL